MVLPHGPRESGPWAEIYGSTPKPPFHLKLCLQWKQTYGGGCSLQPALLGDFHTGAIAILKSLNCLPVAYFLGFCLPQLLKFNLVALMYVFSPFSSTLRLLTASVHTDPCLTWHSSLWSLEDTAFTHVLGIK